MRLPHILNTRPILPYRVSPQLPLIALLLIDRKSTKRIPGTSILGAVNAIQRMASLSVYFVKKSDMLSIVSVNSLSLGTFERTSLGYNQPR